MTTTRAVTNGSQAPPHNLAAEEAVLGCCLLGPEALAWAVANLDADDFYRPTHRTIFRLLAELHGDGQPVDAKVVMSALAERGSLPDVGGAPAVHGLLAGAPTAANVGYFGRQVAKAAQLRQTIDATLRGTAMCYADGADPSQVIAAVRSLLDDLERSGGPALAGPVEILHAMLEAKDAEAEGARVTWGLTDLDRFTGGLPPRQLIVLGARPGQGKSSLALQAALHAAAGRRVLFGSYEMGLAEIGQHHLAALGNVSVDTALAEVDGPALADAREDYQRRRFHVLDGHLDLERFCAQVAGLHAREPFDLVVVDYLQLMPVPGRHERRDLEVASISRSLKALAIRCDLPVLALASVNRDADGQMPTLRHLRDSGAIEADADQVIFLQEQPADGDDDRRQREAEEWRIVDAEVAKHRMGKTGRVSLRFDEPRTVFASLAPGWQEARDPSGAR